MAVVHTVIYSMCRHTEGELTKTEMIHTWVAEVHLWVVGTWEH